MNADKKIYERIKEAGLKATSQRIQVLSCISNMKTHPSAEEIYVKVKNNNPSISLGTVYKTLEVLAEHCLIRIVKKEKGNMRYDPIMEKHHHIYLQSSGEIVDYYDEDLNQILEDYFKNKSIEDYDIKDIRLHIVASQKENSHL